MLDIVIPITFNKAQGKNTQMEKMSVKIHDTFIWVSEGESE